MSDFIPLQEGYTHQTYALATTSTTLSVPMNANGILIQALTQNVRFTLDGTTPTASKGFQLKAGDAPLMIILQRQMTLKFVAETAGAILEYEYSGAR